MSHPLTAKNWRAGAGRKGEEMDKPCANCGCQKRVTKHIQKLATLAKAKSSKLKYGNPMNKGTVERTIQYKTTCAPSDAESSPPKQRSTHRYRVSGEVRCENTSSAYIVRTNK